MTDFSLRLLGREIQVECLRCPAAADLLLCNLSAVVTPPSGHADMNYHVTCNHGQFQFTAGGEEPEVTDDPGVFLYLFEQRLVLDLQRLRGDLLFVHAAALVRGGRSTLLVAPSGTGKSTTALALLDRGFGYLSDELAPIDMNLGVIHPYPHALCLKTVPPGRNAFPQGGIRTNRSWHLPVDHTQYQISPQPLDTVVFLQRGAGRLAELQPISAAEATARLLSQVLNALAHPVFGVDAALAVATRCHNLLMTLGSPEDSARLLEAALSPESSEKLA